MELECEPEGEWVQYRTVLGTHTGVSYSAVLCSLPAGRLIIPLMDSHQTH